MARSGPPRRRTSGTRPPAAPRPRGHRPGARGRRSPPRPRGSGLRSPEAGREQPAAPRSTPAVRPEVRASPAPRARAPVTASSRGHWRAITTRACGPAASGTRSPAAAARVEGLAHAQIARATTPRPGTRSRARRGPAPASERSRPRPARRDRASVVRRKNLTGPRSVCSSSSSRGARGPWAPRLRSTPRATSAHSRVSRRPLRTARSSTSGPRYRLRKKGVPPAKNGWPQKPTSLNVWGSPRSRGSTASRRTGSDAE